ncbi:MAG: hypothetical protein HY518_01290 [Candidatus Aenigmarchaeota archaeon]|nr:hypothetical protein [Candidatus Aenigmarchaeota archaeon]
MRGVWYALEAIFAGVIIISFLITLRATFLHTTSPQEIAVKGYNELRSLDEEGILRPYAVAGNVEAINNEIDIFGFGHSVQVCDYTGTCIGAAPDVADVFIATYLISGDVDFEPYVIRLFIYK